MKKKAEDVNEDYPNLSKLIEDMWETMYASNGVGLAAPQIGLSVRILVVDASRFALNEELDPIEAQTLETFKWATDTLRAHSPDVKHNNHHLEVFSISVDPDV